LDPWATHVLSAILVIWLIAGTPYAARRFYAGCRRLVNDMRRDDFLGLDRRSGVDRRERSRKVSYDRRCGVDRRCATAGA
jgi:hypothetical protein